MNPERPSLVSVQLTPTFDEVLIDGVDVFLSSTWEDLETQRREIKEELGRLKWPRLRCMENEVADPVDPLDKCLAMVDRSNIYVALVGCRYGTIVEDRNGDSFSFTEHEYNRAAELGLYSAIFKYKGQCNSIDDPVPLTHFKGKLRKHWTGTFSHQRYDATRNVISALSRARDKCNGRMWVFVRLADGDFDHPRHRLALRASIAGDSNAAVAEIWPTFWWAVGSHCTAFMIHLPARAMRRYLRMKPWERSFRVIYAREHKPGASTIPVLNLLHIVLYYLSLVPRLIRVTFRPGIQRELTYYPGARAPITVNRQERAHGRVYREIRASEEGYADLHAGESLLVTVSLFKIDHLPAGVHLILSFRIAREIGISLAWVMFSLSPLYVPYLLYRARILRIFFFLLRRRLVTSKSDRDPLEEGDVRCPRNTT